MFYEMRWKLNDKPGSREGWEEGGEHSGIPGHQQASIPNVFLCEWWSLVSLGRKVVSKRVFNNLVILIEPN